MMSKYIHLLEALVIVKEVANHANDIMKQGVSQTVTCEIVIHGAPAFMSFSLQDIFQKLIQVQCRLMGNHELVQPGRVGALFIHIFTKVLKPNIILAIGPY